MISESQALIASLLENSQRANLEYARHLAEFGADFIGNAKARKLSNEALDNSLEAFFTGLFGGDMRSVRRSMRQNAIKSRNGMILVPRDHDALYSVIRGILQDRGWYS